MTPMTAPTPNNDDRKAMAAQGRHDVGIPMLEGEDGVIMPARVQGFMRPSSQAPARLRFIFMVHEDHDLPEQVAFDHMRIELN